MEKIKTRLDYEKLRDRDFGKRIKDLKIVKPIVYGNTARPLKKITENGHTHKWKLYVKSYTNEDISAYVKEVHFLLHESFHHPHRIIKKPPYEVDETGWGQFEVTIKILFIDPLERPVTLYHILGLIPYSPNNDNDDNNKNNLVFESYDEIVFMEPRERMQEILENVPQLPFDDTTFSTMHKFEDEKKKTLEAIECAKQSTTEEIKKLQEQLKNALQVKKHLKTELAKGSGKVHDKSD